MNLFIFTIIIFAMFSRRMTTKMGVLATAETSCRWMDDCRGRWHGRGRGHFMMGHGGRRHNMMMGRGGHHHAMMMGSAGNRHMNKGVPTKLLKKTTLVQDDADIGRLPVHTLTFALPPREEVRLHGRRALPHEDIRIDLGDVVKMVIPDHRPTPYSVSDLRQDEFDITFKVYPNGRASGFLDRLKVGDEIRSFGRWEGRERNPGKYVGIIAYGVGITEGLPVARAELEKGDADQVVLLWSSRTKADTFWQDDIAALQRAYPEKFRMVYIFSREHNDGCLHGRVNPDVLKQVFRPPYPEAARFHSVGTEEMMDLTKGMLAKNGYSMPQNELLPHQF
jgi:NAD(P)H-flavin reductase